MGGSAESVSQLSWGLCTHRATTSWHRAVWSLENSSQSSPPMVACPGQQAGPCEDKDAVKAAGAQELGAGSREAWEVPERTVRVHTRAHA